MKNKPWYLFVAGLCLVTIVYFVQKNSLSKNEGVNTIVLPDGWRVVASGEKETVIKAERQSNQTVVPKLILRTEKKKTSDPSAEIEKTKRETENTIYGLKYSATKTEQKADWTIFSLGGKYSNQGTKIDLLQKVYVRSENWFYLTFSYPEGQLKEDEVMAIYGEVDKFIFNTK